VKESLFGTGARTVSKALQFFESVIEKDVDFVQKESQRDLVSDADFAIQRIILNELAVTGIPVVSEEKDNQLDVLQTSEYCWVLDPIDGTTNFSEKIPFYGISLGLMRKQKFYAGTFAMPATKEFFYMIDEGVSYRNEKRLTVKQKPLSQSLVGVSFSSRKQGTEADRQQEFLAFGALNDRSRGTLRLGSAAANICYAAMGRFGLAYGHKNKIWDVAAALAIASAAGCDVLTTKTDALGQISFAVGTKDSVAEARPLLEQSLKVTW